MAEATVLVSAAVCLGCGSRMDGVFRDGFRRFPVEMPVDHLRASLGEGCFHCGGQIQVEFEEAGNGG